MWRRSIGFWKSIDGGIIRRVMKSQAAHMFCQSCRAGTPKGEAEYPRFGTAGSTDALGEERSGNMKGGRSRSQSEYWEALSVQRWMGRRAELMNRVWTSVSEY